MNPEIETASPEAQIQQQNATPIKKSVLDRIKDSIGLTTSTHEQRAQTAREALLNAMPKDQANEFRNRMQRKKNLRRTIRNTIANGILIGTALVGQLSERGATSLQELMTEPTPIIREFIPNVTTTFVVNNEWVQKPVDLALPLDSENFSGIEVLEERNELPGIAIRQITTGTDAVAAVQSGIEDKNMKPLQDVFTPDEAVAAFVIPEKLEESTKEFVEESGITSAEAQSISINKEMPLVIIGATESQAKAPYKLVLEDFPEDKRTVEGIMSELKKNNDLAGDEATIKWIAENLVRYPDGFTVIWNGGSTLRHAKDNLQEAASTKNLSHIFETGQPALAIELGSN